MEEDGTCTNCGRVMNFRNQGYYYCNKCNIKEYVDISLVGTKGDLNKKVPKPAIVSFLDAHERQIHIGSIVGVYSLLIFMLGVLFILYLT